MASKPLSVCMFTNLFPPVVSGSAIQSFALARELCLRGCDVSVITAKVSEDAPDNEVVDGVHVYRLQAVRLPRLPIAMNFPWLSYTFKPGNIRKIRVILEQHQPDVLHLHNHMFDLAFSAVSMRHRFQIPLVITIHTVIKHVRALYNIFLYPADRWFLKHQVIRRADAIICPDVNVQEYVTEAFGKCNRHLLPYGIGLPEEPAEEGVEQLRLRYGLEGKRVILSLGHVHEIRNRKDLIEALPGVLKVFPNTVLLIVGIVATNISVELAQTLGVERSIIFTGPVPHSEVAALLALAEIEGHWLNQEDPEKTSLGVATLEAMAAGKTALVVANENTHGPGVIKDGENIVLVERDKPHQLAQVIIELLSDEGKCKAIGGRAQETIRNNFSWDSVCARTVDVYADAIRSFDRLRSR